MSIANLISEFRAKNNLSLRKAGKLLGISAKTIMNLEEGKVLPSVLTLVNISKVLQIPIDKLIDIYLQDMGIDN